MGKGEDAGERPTQGEETCRLVGLLRGMRGEKRRRCQRKTYAVRENWQVSRSFEVDERWKGVEMPEKDLRSERKLTG